MVFGFAGGARGGGLEDDAADEEAEVVNAARDIRERVKEERMHIRAAAAVKDMCGELRARLGGGL